MIGNKIADKITSVSKKKSTKELHNNDEDVEITTHKKRYISPEERQQIIDELRLVPKNYWWMDVKTIIAMYKNGMPKNNEFVGQCIESTI